MSTILCFDPGTTKGSAWALFEGAKLVLASSIYIYTIPFPDLVVIEKPCWHEKAGRSPAIVGDLIDLGIEVGRLAEHWENRDVRVELVLASTWKRSVPKAIMSQRIYERLTADEVSRLLLKSRHKTSKSAKDHDHNLLDAVGIGLWKLGRMHGAA